MWKIKKEDEDFVIYASKKRCPEIFPEPPPGWKAVNAGGGYPYYIIYNPENVYTVWLSAREVEKWNAGTLYLDDPEKFVEEVPASSHGCWKLTCNQLILVIRKPAELCEKIYSAYELAQEIAEVLPTKVVERTTEKAFELPVNVKEKDCLHCKKKQERTGNPYSLCLGHATLDSLYSSTFNESRRYDYNYRLKVEDERVEKALKYPTQRIDYAFLTKDGVAYLVRGKYAFKTKDESVINTLFS